MTGSSRCPSALPKIKEVLKLKTEGTITNARRNPELTKKCLQAIHELSSILFCYWPPGSFQVQVKMVAEELFDAVEECDK
jgi:hypothetical protein